jgi:hypothetical protein
MRPEALDLVHLIRAASMMMFIWPVDPGVRSYATSENLVGSEDIYPQHPPDKEQRDDRHDDVTNPLSRGFRLGFVLHGCC